MRVMFCSKLTIENVALDSVHLLAGLISNVELAVDDDLHLVVSVVVDERRALLETVEAGGDGGDGVVGLRGHDVAEEGVLVGDERRLEGRLGAGEVGEGDRGHGAAGFLFGGRAGGGFGFAEEGTHC